MLGSYVTKEKGYTFDGVVVSVFKTSKGDERLVVEEANSGMLHIFNKGQLTELTGIVAESIEFRVKNRAWVRKNLGKLLTDLMIKEEANTRYVTLREPKDGSFNLYDFRNLVKGHVFKMFELDGRELQIDGYAFRADSDACRNPKGIWGITTTEVNLRKDIKDV